MTSWLRCACVCLCMRVAAVPPVYPLDFFRLNNNWFWWIDTLLKVGVFLVSATEFVLITEM